MFSTSAITTTTSSTTPPAAHHQTFTDGNPFKVFGIELTITTTTIVTETFNVSEDESAGVNTAADPNAANDVNPLVDVPPAAITEAGAIGYAKSPTSVLAPGSLFAGSVGADEPGSYSFAITDGHGNPISSVDSGLKTLDGTHIMLSTDASGAVVGTAGLTEVFKVYVDGNGFVWIAQYQAIAHDVDGSSQAAFDDIATVTADLHIKATLTDFDGDSTSAVSGVALKIQFQDDGPVAVNDVDSGERRGSYGHRQCDHRHRYRNRIRCQQSRMVTPTPRVPTARRSRRSPVSPPTRPRTARTISR